MNVYVLPANDGNSPKTATVSRTTSSTCSTKGSRASGGPSWCTTTRNVGWLAGLAGSATAKGPYVEVAEFCRAVHQILQVRCREHEPVVRWKQLGGHRPGDHTGWSKVIRTGRSSRPRAHIMWPACSCGVSRVDRKIGAVDPVAEDTVPYADRPVVVSHMPLVRARPRKRQLLVSSIEDLNGKDVLRKLVPSVPAGRRAAHEETNRRRAQLRKHRVDLQPAVFGRRKREAVLNLVWAVLCARGNVSAATTATRRTMPVQHHGSRRRSSRRPFPIVCSACFTKISSVGRPGSRSDHRRCFQHA